MELISQINNEEDLLQAWLEYYVRLGVTAFHLIVHGSPLENTKLFELRNSYPILIRDTYGGYFSSEEKQKHINGILSTMQGKWLLLVDSDEFVEFPYRSISTTIRVLEFLGANALYAPMVQRVAENGSLDTPQVIPDPFREFPLCSLDLYRKMGVEACTSKYPLFRCGDSTFVTEGGNHHPPNGSSTVLSPLRGVTHHFKWRAPVLKRLGARINSPHTWRHESLVYQGYLEKNGYQLPVDDAFLYSRQELFHRGLLRKAGLFSSLPCVLKHSLTYLPPNLQTTIRGSYHTVQRAFCRGQLKLKNRG
jgi:hypothetical protein